MDFEYLGAHCAVEYCKQRDFLPFACDGCHLKFCIDHRGYKSHGCNSIPQGNRVITCPICNKGIPYADNQDPNILWEIHSTKSCRKGPKLSCSSKGCKKIISEVNSIICNKCNQIVCLSHRYSDQHQCAQIGRTNSKSNSGCIIL